MTDESLWRAGRFDELYARYEKPLFGFLVRLLGRREEAEEIFHETFLATFDGGFEDRGPGSFRAWVYQIARARALNRARGRRRGEIASARLRAETEASVGPAEGSPDSEGRERALGAAVERLPPRLAEVYRLRAAGLSYDEMAARLAVPTGTVRSRIHALVKSLREELASWIVN